MNRMESAVAQLAGRLQETTTGVGIIVVAHHYVAAGDIRTFPLNKIWFSRTAFRVSDSGRSRVIWSDRDFCIPVSEYKDVDGNQLKPGKGTWFQITLPSPLGSQKYEAFAPSDEPVCKYLDHENTIYVVHTKKV